MIYVCVEDGQEYPDIEDGGSSRIGGPRNAGTPVWANRSPVFPGVVPVRSHAIFRV